MIWKHLPSATAGCLLTLAATTAAAQDARVEELERRLQERDKVIAELLERVETLERRVGVHAAVQAHKPAREPGAAPGIAGAPGAPADTAPGTVVVDEAAAERALERSLTREGAILLPRGVLELEPALLYARQEDDSPRFLTSAGSVSAAETLRSSDTLTGDITLRLGLPFDSQIEAGLPYRWREVDSVTRAGFVPTDASSRSGSGVGDLRLGVATTLLREGLWRPDLVGRLTWDTATGEQDDDGVGLGGGFHEVRGSLSAIKRQDPMAFVGGVSYQHTLEEDDIRPGRTIGASLGSFIALSPETSLSLQIAAAHQRETEFSGRDIDGSDQTRATFVVGGSTLLAPGMLLNLSAGIGLTEDADDFSLSLSLPIRFRDPLY